MRTKEELEAGVKWPLLYARPALEGFLPNGGTHMFSHIMVGTNDIDRAKSFYDAVLGTLGVPPGFVDRHRVFWRTPTGVFAASLPIDGEQATIGNGSCL